MSYQQFVPQAQLMPMACSVKRKSNSPFPVSKNGKSYSQLFIQLRGQATLLQQIKESCICFNSSKSESSQKSIALMSEKISDLQNCSYSTLKVKSEQLMIVLSDILREDGPNPLIRLAEMLIPVALALNRIVSGFFVEDFLVSSVAFDETARDNQQKPHSDTIVCRICGEDVPIDLFDDHTNYCITAFQSESRIQSTDHRLIALKNRLMEGYLNIRWPGEQNQAISFVLPSLHCVYLIDRALSLNLYSIDSIGELEQLTLSAYAMSGSSFSCAFIDFISLSLEKRSACYALLVASNVLGRTTFWKDERKAQLQPKICDFEFIAPISSGAFARVFLARKTQTGDIYAIKIIPKKNLLQKNQIRRAITEKDILLGSNSPYIINFYYSIIGEYNLYLVMEYVPGGDLFSLLQNVGSLDEYSTRIYTKQIVNALSFLNSKGIIHRDLKPDNILITAEGKLKLTDFGLSEVGVVGRSFAVSHDHIASEPSIVGTPDYISPEVLLSRPHSSSADIWSLGVIVYEMLVGVPPFHGKNEEETHANIIRGKYRPLPSDFSNDAADFVRSLLQIDPNNRPTIDVILNHPWLNSIDISIPPFVPDLKSPEDTIYFLERNRPQFIDDNDIKADIELSKTQKILKQETEMSNFQAVSVKQLKMKNSEISQSCKRTRALTYIPQDGNNIFPLPIPDKRKRSMSGIRANDDMKIPIMRKV